MKVAIGPPIENGFYYDFEFPEPIAETDLEAIEAEVRRELADGRSWSARRSRATMPARASPRRASRTRSSSSTTAEGDISLYTQGDFTDLCRGPHLQDSGPIKAFKLTGLAGAYWRGDEKNTQLTRIYGTAFFSQADLDAHLERLEQARARDHRRLGAQLDLFHFDPHSPGSPLWHPKGMVIYNQLEAVRRRENERRGYLEVKTPLLYDKTLWITSGHWEKYRDNMFLIPGDDDDQTLRAQADELPRPHAAVRQPAAQLPRPAAALRRGGAAPPQRADGDAARPDARAVRYAGRRAHLLHRGAGRRRGRRRSSTTSRYLYGLFGMEPHAELSTRPENKLGTDEQWDAPRARCGRRSSGTGSRTRSARARARSTARRSTST